MGRKIVVDGSNVAFEEFSKGGTPKVSNLVAVRKHLEERGFHPMIIVDASLKHKVDDPDQLEALIFNERIHQVPAGTDADYWVLETAQRIDGLVVSNDRFLPYHDAYPWIEERRIPFMISEGLVQLYEPAIEAFLQAAAAQAVAAEVEPEQQPAA
jgi:hypothetical protein